MQYQIWDFHSDNYEYYCLLGQVEEFPEDGWNRFLQNDGNNLPDYTVPYPTFTQINASTK